MRIVRTIVWLCKRFLQIAFCLLLPFSLIAGATLFRVFNGMTGSAELPADCAIVFGAAVHRQSKPGPGIKRRVYTAADLYRQGMVSSIFFSGGKGSPNLKSEAQVMKEVAMEQGVPSAVLQLEGESTSTWENIHNTKPLTKNCKSVFGISDRYHLARIEYLAERQGYTEFSTYPAHYNAHRAFELHSVLREVVAILYYSVVTPEV